MSSPWWRADDAFTVTGNPGTGWNRVEFVNRGHGYHAFDLVSVKAGVTAAQVQAAATPDSKIPKRLLRDDGVNPAVPVALGPGQKTTIVTQFEPGHFVIVSPIAAQTGGSQISKGAVSVLDIPNTASPLPEPGAGEPTVTIDDESITLPDTMSTRTGPRRDHQRGLDHPLVRTREDATWDVARRGCGVPGSALRRGQRVRSGHTSRGHRRRCRRTRAGNHRASRSGPHARSLRIRQHRRNGARRLLPRTARGVRCSVSLPAQRSARWRASAAWRRIRCRRHVGPAHRWVLRTKMTARCPRPGHLDKSRARGDAMGFTDRFSEAAQPLARAQLQSPTVPPVPTPALKGRAHERHGLRGLE